VSEKHITYVCPQTNTRVDTGKVEREDDIFKWMEFKHDCPKCGETHRLGRPRGEKW
jgi:hypothetical protein